MSAKSTPVGTSAPPIGASSKQTRHQFGFLRDGEVNGSGLKMNPPIPLNGARHIPQRGEEGTIRKNLRIHNPGR